MLLLPRDSFMKCRTQLTVARNKRAVNASKRLMTNCYCGHLFLDSIHLWTLEQGTAKLRFALLLECGEALCIVVRGAQLSLGDVFLFHGLPQADAFVTDRRDQFARCHKCT